MFKTPPHFDSLAQALVSLFGNSVAIARTDRLTGGDINKAYGLTLNNGQKIFMKANAKENASFFTAEALALSAIESTKTIKTPKILCTGTDAGEEVGYSFLFLEYIEPAPKVKNYWSVFAQELAAMHKADTQKFAGEKKFGFLQDNFIGARKQENNNSDSWIDFFRDSRLAPQFKEADSYFDTNERKLVTKLLDHIEEYLIEPESPSLLHGDLWSGNAMCGSDGKAWLIDPASYAMKSADLLICIVSVLVLIVVDAAQERMSLRQTLARKSVALRWALIYLCLFAVILFGMYGHGYGSAFIYEQF